jgi:hypothetical protein
VDGQFWQPLYMYNVKRDILQSKQQYHNKVYIFMYFMINNMKNNLPFCTYVFMEESISFDLQIYSDHSVAFYR